MARMSRCEEEGISSIYLLKYFLACIVVLSYFSAGGTDGGDVFIGTSSSSIYRILYLMVSPPTVVVAIIHQ